MPVNEFDHLLVSQYNMVSVFEDEINRQIKRKQEGFDAIIRIKINNLENIYMIDLLYKASQQGVTVDLLVRRYLLYLAGQGRFERKYRSEKNSRPVPGT